VSNLKTHERCFGQDPDLCNIKTPRYVVILLLKVEDKPPRSRSIPSCFVRMPNMYVLDTLETPGVIVDFCCQGYIESA
jgi:hypothetical protein